MALNGTGTVGSFTHSGGVFSGVGNFTVTGAATLTRGIQSGPGTTALQGGTTINTPSTINTNWYYLDGGRSLALGGNSQIVGANGILNLNGGTNVFGSGSIRVQAGAVLDDQTTAGLQVLAPSVSAADNGSDAIVVNEGTLRKSGSAGTSFVASRFDNRGVVEVQNGAFRFDGGGTDTAAIYRGPGTVQFNGGNRTIDAASTIGAQLAQRSAGAQLSSQGRSRVREQPCS